MTSDVCEITHISPDPRIYNILRKTVTQIKYWPSTIANGGQHINFGATYLFILDRTVNL